MLYKEIGQSFKDVDVKAGIVTGYFSAFGMKDSDGDIIIKGAYTKTIAEHGPESKQPRIKHLLDHDKKKAVGKINVLKEDDFGLYYESKSGSHSLGQDFLKMVEDGIITEHSIGFDTIREQQKSDGNHLTELHLWEGSSLQCWGACQHTPILGVKSMSELVQQIGRIQSAMKSASYTDETFQELAIYLSRLEKQLTKKADAGSSTSADNSYYKHFIN